MNRYYPVYMNLSGRTCLVVGGGAVAARKAASLLECGAMVRLVAPKVCEAVADMEREGAIERIAGVFRPEQMDGAALAIGSTDNSDVNRLVFEEASRRNIPVNIVDQPQLCTFIVPSVVRRGDLVIAISTSGKSPAVAKRARMALEKTFGDEWAAYLEMMGEARERLLSSVADDAERERKFNRLADSPMLDKIKTGDLAGARAVMEDIVR
jgi:precorrin-2 dehydrogenase/sirohydrochlorin ferrochelatase